MGNIYSGNDIRGRAGETLTTEYVWNVGKAFSDWLPDEGDVAVARTENADESTVHALIEGLLLMGRDVIDLRVGDTQTVNTGMVDYHAIGGALVGQDTADNLVVITLFDPQGAPVTDLTGLKDVLERVESGNFLPAATKGSLKTIATKE